MINEGKKCVIYVRVSTEMQVDGYSLDAQKRALQRYAEREDMIVVDIYEDAGKSGKSIEGRPAFSKMLSDIKNGLGIDYVLVYKLSRFGRNATDILTSLSLIQSYDVNLICAEDGINSSQTSGRLLISVLSSVSEIERENILEQTMNGRKEKARQGKWNGGNAPYGYKLERVGNNDKKQLVIDEDKVEIVKLIFNKFINEDMKYNSIAKYLNFRGLDKTRVWHYYTVKDIIRNPIYCGKIAYGRKIKEKIKGTNDVKFVRTDDYILVDGEHEAIISEKTWELAQSKIETISKGNKPSVGRGNIYLLSGILKCPVCGTKMYVNRNTWKTKSGRRNEAYYYLCGNNKVNGNCFCSYNKTLRRDIIENEVINAISELVDNPVFADEIKRRIGVQIDTNEIDNEITEYITKLKEVENNKRALEYNIDNLPIDAKYRDRKLADMNYRLDKLYDTIYELEALINDAQLKRKSIEMQAITLENIYAILKNFNKIFNKITDDEKRTVFNSFIKEIQVFKKGTSPQNLKSITFNFPIFIDGEEINEILFENENLEYIESEFSDKDKSKSLCENKNLVETKLGFSHKNEYKNLFENESLVKTGLLFSNKNISNHIEVTMDFNGLYPNIIS